MTIDIVQEFIEKFPDAAEFAPFGEGTSEEWVSRAEQRLGIKFPASYVWWLRNYAGGEVHGEEIFSIYEMDFDSVVGGDIVYVNELERSNGSWEPHHLIIQSNDQGETYYLDLSVAFEDGECPVYVDIGGRKVRYGDSFGEFLVKKIGEGA